MQNDLRSACGRCSTRSRSSLLSSPSAYEKRCLAAQPQVKAEKQAEVEQRRAEFVGEISTTASDCHRSQPHEEEILAAMNSSDKIAVFFKIMDGASCCSVSQEHDAD